MDRSGCTALFSVAGKGKIIDLALRQFKMFCFVWCGCKGKDHGLGRCLDCPGCSALSAVAGKGRTWTWCLDCSGYTALSAVAGKEKTMDLVDAWTVQDMLLCLL